VKSVSVLSLFVVLSAICAVDQFKGKWVVLYFYPKDFISGCTIEAHNFQHDIDKYAQIMEYNGMTLAARNTFVIDPAGTIRKVYLKVNPQEHCEDLLADPQPLQSAK